MWGLLKLNKSPPRDIVYWASINSIDTDLENIVNSCDIVKSPKINKKMKFQ